MVVIEPGLDSPAAILPAYIERTLSHIIFDILHFWRMGFPLQESKYYKEFVKEFPQFGDNIPGKVIEPWCFLMTYILINRFISFIAMNLPRLSEDHCLQSSTSFKAFSWRTLSKLDLAWSQCIVQCETRF